MGEKGQKRREKGAKRGWEKGAKGPGGKGGRVTSMGGGEISWKGGVKRVMSETFVRGSKGGGISRPTEGGEGALDWGWQRCKAWWGRHGTGKES